MTCPICGCDYFGENELCWTCWDNINPVKLPLRTTAKSSEKCKLVPMQVRFRVINGIGGVMFFDDLREAWEYKRQFASACLAILREPAAINVKPEYWQIETLNGERIVTYALREQAMDHIRHFGLTLVAV